MGSSKNVSIEERSVWRNYIVEELRKKSKTLKAFNPNNHFSYEKNDPNNEKMVMDFFLHRLENAKVAVLNLNNSDKSVGTGIEFGKALADNKFIVGFGCSNVYSYMKERCSIVFKDVSEVVDFLLEHWE